MKCMAAVKFVLELLGLVALLREVESEVTISLWRRTQVSTTWLDATQLVMKHFNKKNLFSISLKIGPIKLCTTFDWCRTACVVDGENQVLLSLLSVPFNLDPTGAPYLLCYTRREPNYVRSQAALAASGSPLGAYTLRTVDNLIDGLYDYTLNSCFFAKKVPVGPFLAIDLKGVMTVRKVTLTAQPNSEASRYFGNFEVRVGATPASGDFSSYQLLGSLPTMAPSADFEYSAENATGISGKFVSVQAQYTDDGMQVCHVEIFT